MREQTVSTYKKWDILTNGNERITVEKCVVRWIWSLIQLWVYDTEWKFHILESSRLEKV